MRALIFDLDGTLVDTVRVYRDAAELHQSLDKLGLPI
jgi:beta-phosphoglucomutase-like phosphatase (HAD superfamily)